MGSFSTSSPQHDAVVTQYDRWARIYDRFWGRYVQKTLPVLRRSARISAGERVLDLACGTGELERRIADAEPGAQLVGIDLAPTMIEQARAKLQGTTAVRFEQADAHDLPFEDDAFDVVVCASTFHYFTYPTDVLAEVARVLRPGGRFVVLDWCRDFWTCRVMDAVLQRLDPAHRDCYTVDEIRSFLTTAGLEVRYHFRYRFDLVWGMMVLGAVLPHRS